MPLHDESEPRSVPGLAIRGALGGALMGLANLVPGVSGGTMLLAAGIYPQFVGGIAEVTTLRFRLKSLVLLACVVGAAAAAIVLLAGPVSGLVVEHRWVMYSIFIGLTLGGVPLLWRMLHPLHTSSFIAAALGIAAMVGMAMLRPGDAGASGDGHPYFLYFVAGLAGASAMVLPGVSGGYLLLILGQYVTILTAISAAKDGARGGDWSAVIAQLHVIIPVGLGVVAGVVGVSNLVKMLLDRFEKATLGALLGLLLGAVVGIWPFQAGVAPLPGETFKGDRVVEVNGELRLEQTGRLIEPAQYPTATFRPEVPQVGGSLALIAAGFAVSVGIAHVGGGGRRSSGR